MLKIISDWIKSPIKTTKSTSISFPLKRSDLADTDIDYVYEEAEKYLLQLGEVVNKQEGKAKYCSSLAVAGLAGIATIFKIDAASFMPVFSLECIAITSALLLLLCSLWFSLKAALSAYHIGRIGSKPSELLREDFKHEAFKENKKYAMKYTRLKSLDEKISINFSAIECRGKSIRYARILIFLAFLSTVIVVLSKFYAAGADYPSADVQEFESGLQSLIDEGKVSNAPFESYGDAVLLIDKNAFRQS